LSKGNIYLLVFIIILFAFSLWAVVPLDSTRLGKQGLSLGLDLKGGSHIVYKADLEKRDPSQSAKDAMDGVKDKIERRVNAYGVAEPIVLIQGDDRILVQLPGVENIEEALNLIGEIAELDFRELKPEEDGEEFGLEEEDPWIEAVAVGSDGLEKPLTGKYLKPTARADVNPQTSEPLVLFEWDDEGAILFKQITERNLNKRLAIFLDNELITAPVVQSVIEESGQITGLDLDDAILLAIQLNSGSLDVPLDIIHEQDVDATLGKDSIQKSLIAGAIGLCLVVVFMVLYYRVSGLVASCALIIYGVLFLAIIKLLPEPINITLTLPGIAALILSIGMAVDANVLIFERMKEEIRAGRTIGAAVEAGFNRAWPAIRDGNVTTLIACAILIWFGNRLGAPIVQGFALVLFIGVALSMFSAIMITRTFLRFTIRAISNSRAYGVKK
jgi:preprotein translocase subunit SecD